MPKKKSSKPPVMRQDRKYACVYIAGNKVFLGKWGSEEAEKNYKRVLAEWVSGLGESDISPEGSVTLDELTLQFLRWAKGYHEIRTYDRFKTALTVMLELYSGTLIQEFGCRKLLVLQDRYVQMKYARTYVNKLVSCIRQVFSWGVSRELCPVVIAEALEHVPPLKKHKTEAEETTPRLAVADEIVESTLPFLLPTLQDMVKVQRLAGMRPSELWRMRTCDIDQSKDIWIYSPVYHKSEGKGCSRHIALGKEEQEILLPRMARKGHAEPKNRETSLARIVAVAHPIFPDDVPAMLKNQRLGEEPIRLLSGILELRMVNGVRMVLEGPATFHIQSATTTFCHEGRLSVEVPKGAEGFEVRTPLMNVRDIGTEFIVNVTKSESAVHVVKGLVEIDRLTSDWKPVREGVGMIAKQGGMVEQTPANKGLYVTKIKMDELVRNFETQAKTVRNERIVRLLNDPDLLMYLDFSEDARQEKGLLKTIGCQKAVGRWPDKNAIAFAREKDHLQLSAPASRSSFTLMASVRLNAFAKASDVIFSIGDSNRGALHWQLNQRGEMQVLIGAQENKGLTNYASSRFLTNQHTEVWLRLAVVFDAEHKTVTHYFEGKPIAKLPWKLPGPFDFSRAELGNWQHEDSTPAQRFFNGRIEEFILLGRAAGPDEIRQTHRD